MKRCSTTVPIKSKSLAMDNTPQIGAKCSTVTIIKREANQFITVQTSFFSYMFYEQWQPKTHILSSFSIKTSHSFPSLKSSVIHSEMLRLLLSLKSAQTLTVVLHSQGFLGVQWSSAFFSHKDKYDDTCFEAKVDTARSLRIAHMIR